MRKSAYFHAHVERSQAHIVSATFQFVEHVAFYRTVDVENSIFEFFVAPDLVDVFVDVIESLQKIDVIHWYKELPAKI